MHAASAPSILQDNKPQPVAIPPAAKKGIDSFYFAA